MIRTTAVLLLLTVFAARIHATPTPDSPPSPDSTPDGTADAADAPIPAEPQIAEIRVGFAGHMPDGTAKPFYKVGVWTPVQIVLSGKTWKKSRVTVTVPDGDGVPSRVAAEVPAGSGRLVVPLVARFGRAQSTMEVTWREGDQVLDQQTHAPPKAVDASRSMVVTVGSDDLGVRRAADSLDREEENQVVVASLADVASLPTSWYGYEGVESLVIAATSEIGTLSKPQADALDEWIGMGGRLVLAVGSEAATMLADDAPLTRFAPGRFQAIFPLRDTGSLEMFADSSASIVTSKDRRKQRTLQVAHLADPEGVVEVVVVDLPLVVRTPRVFGQILFLAADLDRGLLAKWEDRAPLVARLLDLSRPGSEQSRKAAGEMHFGFDDMSGQLRSSLDRFEGVQVMSFFWVSVLVVAYLVLIGPADYFFLRKCTRRMQWTWLTFPLIVVAFSVGAYLLAYRLKGSETRVHQAELLDIDVESKTLRGTSWANVFSPRTDTYDFSIVPQFGASDPTPEPDIPKPDAPKPDAPTPDDPTPVVAWLGLPGQAIGAMNPKADNPVEWTHHYDFAPGLTSMDGVPVLVWSTKSLTARWKESETPCPKVELRDTDSLTGSITNQFDFPLENCVLAYHRWAYVLENLEPGETIRLGAMTKRSELKTLLTGRKIIYTEKKDHYHQESTPYDQTSLDTEYILRAMMFFHASGGEQYTHLTNGYQSFVDFTDLLKTGRAILIARAPNAPNAPKASSATWTCNGESFDAEDSRRVTLMRFVLPVEKEK